MRFSDNSRIIELIFRCNCLRRSDLLCARSVCSSTWRWQQMHRINVNTYWRWLLSDENSIFWCIFSDMCSGTVVIGYCSKGVILLNKNFIFSKKLIIRISLSVADRSSIRHLQVHSSQSMASISSDSLAMSMLLVRWYNLMIWFWDVEFIKLLLVWMKIRLMRISISMVLLVKH